ncbi:MAG: hypothetical protein B7Y88_13865 [Sphingomonadales bacterium 32-64-17]|nr:MAG: hypothetical protein B7Y88_13865 [Sphingomonadales bacterium 32-64-17]
MATKYSVQQKGVADGTAIPPNKADGREVNAARTVLLASKAAAEAWNSGDVIYLGYKPEGAKITDIKVCTDTSMATSTFDIGIGGDPRNGGAVETVDKYVDAKGTTTTDVPTSLGPEAATLDDTAGDGEHLWLTVNTANIGSAVLLTVAIEMCAIN